MLTRRYNSLNEIQRDKPEADVYMTGSDQVWSQHGLGEYDLAYFLGFCDENDRRIAYAASMGNNINDVLKNDKVKKLLVKYNFITVREKAAQQLLSSIGIKTCVVLDPTFLIDKEEWIKILNCKHNNKKRRYILLYQIHMDKRTTQNALYLSNMTGFPIVRICTRLDQSLKPGKACVLPCMKKLVSLFESADYIVTDSFHGTALAINLNVPFFTCLSKDGSDTNRQISILEQMGLQDRIVEDVCEIDVDSINWEYVNSIIRDRRAESISLLTKMIED